MHNALAGKTLVAPILTQQVYYINYNGGNYTRPILVQAKRWCAVCYFTSPIRYWTPSQDQHGIDGWRQRQLIYLRSSSIKQLERNT